MPALKKYYDDLQNSLFNEVGAFFAFSNEQFKESSKQGVVYVHCGSGLLCPKGQISKLSQGLEDITKRRRAKDMQTNEKSAIIQREMSNYEVQISCELDDVYGALEGYPITKEEIDAEYKIFFAKCVENDWF